MTAEVAKDDSLPPFDENAVGYVVPQGSFPILIDSPHSGSTYPEDFKTCVSEAILRGAEDWKVDQLFDGTIGAPVSWLAARFPRAYIDPNRRLDDVDPDLIDGEWPTSLNPGPKSELGIGLFRHKTNDGSPLLAAPLSVAGLQARIDRCWRPYRRKLQEILDLLHRHYGAVWHINVHSMKSVGTAITPDGPGSERPDMVIGDLDGQSCSSEFTAFVAERLRTKGYSVAINDPYKGAEIIRLHGRPAENRHSLQIEMKRSLYMDEATIDYAPHYQRLRMDLQELVEDLVDWVGAKPEVQAALDSGKDPVEEMRSPSPYAWLEEYNCRDMSWLARSNLPIEQLLACAQDMMTRPEIIEMLRERAKPGAEFAHHDDWSLLSSYTSYYAWKHGLPDIKSATLGLSLLLVQAVLEGKIKGLESTEARAFLRQFPGVE